MSNTRTISPRRHVFTAIALAAVLVLAFIVLLSPLSGVTSVFAQDRAKNDITNPSPHASDDPTGAADPQCRVDALTAYMKDVGFKDGDYVIGEDNVDTTAAEFSESGSLGFGENGEVVATREDLQEVFASTDPKLQAVTEAQVRKFPELDRAVVLNTENWEIVQITVDSQVAGNTGYSDGQQVFLDTRESDTGDAGWYFIDTTTCKVAIAEYDAMGKKVSGDTPDSEAPVGFIRAGCINPGDGFRPVPARPTNPPHTTPPTHTPPPPPPTTPPTCPPDMPYGSPPNCKDGPDRDPAQQGNAPVGGGQNADPGPGAITVPTQPPSTPYVPPPPPPPAPPAPVNDNPSPTAPPAPTPDPTPLPPPPPEPSAPPPTAPESGCIVIPGVEDCT